MGWVGVVGVKGGSGAGVGSGELGRNSVLGGGEGGGR